MASVPSLEAAQERRAPFAPRRDEIARGLVKLAARAAFKTARLVMRADFLDQLGDLGAVIFLSVQRARQRPSLKASLAVSKAVALVDGAKLLEPSVTT